MSPTRLTSSFRPAAERLESRLCLSASLVEGVLVVQGTDQRDNIRVVGQGDTIVVRDSEGLAVFSSDTVEAVAVNAGAGADRVRLSRLEVPTTVDGGPGNDVLIGGNQDDLFLGGDGDDRLRGGGGTDELFGEAGDDRLSGDFGDDDLSGGPGFDRLSGGPGLDFAADLDADLLGDTLLSVEEAPGLVAPTSTVPDLLRPNPLFKPFDTSLFFGAPLFGNALVGDPFVNDPFLSDPVVINPTFGLRFGDPRFGLGSPIATPFLTRDRFFTVADLTGVTPVSGAFTTDARLPGFMPIDQPIVFPGFVAFPQSSFVAIVPGT